MSRRFRSWLLIFTLGLSPAFAAPRPAADFTFVDMAGETRALKEWRGKVVVVNFWATWCAPCRTEMPGFAALQRQYGSQGVQFVGVAFDDRPTVQAFLQKTKLAIPYPLLPADEEILPLMRAYGNAQAVLPHTVVVDRQGRVILSHIGILSKADMARHIEAALAP